MLEINPSSDKPFFGVVQLATMLGYKQLFRPDAGRHRPDINYIAGILQNVEQCKNRKLLCSVQGELRQEWSQLLETKHQLLSHYVSQIKGRYKAEIPKWINKQFQQKKLVDIPWNDPSTWQLIRMVLLFDEGCYLLSCAKNQQLITEQCFSRAYFELGRPIRFCLAKMLRSLEERQLLVAL